MRNSTKYGAWMNGGCIGLLVGLRTGFGMDISWQTIAIAATVGTLTLITIVVTEPIPEETQ